MIDCVKRLKNIKIYLNCFLHYLFLSWLFCYSVLDYKPEAIDLKQDVINSDTIEEVKYKYKKLNFKEKIDKIKDKLLQSGEKL